MKMQIKKILLIQYKFTVICFLLVVPATLTICFASAKTGWQADLRIGLLFAVSLLTLSLFPGFMLYCSSFERPPRTKAERKKFFGYVVLLCSCLLIGISMEVKFISDWFDYPIQKEGVITAVNKEDFFLNALNFNMYRISFEVNNDSIWKTGYYKGINNSNIARNQFAHNLNSKVTVNYMSRSKRIVSVKHTNYYIYDQRKYYLKR